MIFAINVYRFATIGATGFRQTLLVNTAIVDRVVLPYLFRCMAVVAKHFQMQTAYDSDPKPIPQLTKEVCVGMRTALEFLALASFHMGSHSQALLPQNVFTLDILELPVKEVCAPPSTIFTWKLYQAGMVGLRFITHLLPTKGRFRSWQEAILSCQEVSEISIQPFQRVVNRCPCKMTVLDHASKPFSCSITDVFFAFAHSWPPFFVLAGLGLCETSFVANSTLSWTKRQEGVAF